MTMKPTCRLITIVCTRCGKTFSGRPRRKLCNDCRTLRKPTKSNNRRYIEHTMRDLGPQDY